jgi:hypothetical protein
MKYRFRVKGTVSPKLQLANEAAAKARGLPKPVLKKRPPLTVVGGGVSASRQIEQLRKFDGDIWACGSAYPWVRDQGIMATFFNCDPLPEQANYARGDEHAILASICDPSVFDAIGSAECFDLQFSKEYANHGVTAVTATPVLALEMGYTNVFFLGCESSFNGTTHAYAYNNPHAKFFGIWVRVGDTVYPSSPQYLMQAELLAQILRECPGVFHEASGGLLRALVKDEEYEIIAVNKTMHDDLEIYLDSGLATPEQARQILPILDMRV